MAGRYEDVGKYVRDVMDEYINTRQGFINKKIDQVQSDKRYEQEQQPNIYESMMMRGMAAENPQVMQAMQQDPRARGVVQGVQPIDPNTQSAFRPEYEISRRGISQTNPGIATFLDRIEQKKERGIPLSKAEASMRNKHLGIKEKVTSIEEIDKEKTRKLAIDMAARDLGTDSDFVSMQDIVRYMPKAAKFLYPNLKDVPEQGEALPTAVNDQTGETMVFKDGSWQKM